MAYDTDKLINLGQGMMIAERVNQKDKEMIASLTAADIAYGNETVKDALDNGATAVVATEEEVEEMLDEIFGIE